MSDTATLEADVRDMKAILAGLLPTLARIDERLNHVASVMATR
jgi:hypothetical protein